MAQHSNPLTPEVMQARDAMACAVLSLRLELWNTLEMTCETRHGVIDLRTVPRDAPWIKLQAEAIRKIEHLLGPTKDDCPAWLDGYLNWYA